MSISRKQTAVIPSNLANIDQIDFNLIGTPPAVAEGRLFYDSVNHTLTLFSDIVEPSLQIGQEVWKRVKNETGATIDNGELVYISGASGELPSIEKAQADAFSTSLLIGMTTHSIGDEEEGWVTIFGEVRGVDTSGFSAGALIYLSATTAGAYTETKPDGLNNVVRVGVVITSGITGKILIQPIVLGRTEPPRAEIYVTNNTTATTINTVNVWVPIPQITQSGQLLGFTHNGTGVLTLSSTAEDVTGIYKVDAAIASAAVSANKTYEYAIFINGSEQTNTKTKRRFGSGDVGAQSLTGLLSLSGGDTVDLRVRNITDATNILVENVNINMIKLST